VIPAEKIPPSNPTAKRGRPRKEKPNVPTPKRPRGRPPGLSPETLALLWEFIFSLDLRSGGKTSRKRGLEAAALKSLPPDARRKAVASAVRFLRTAAAAAETTCILGKGEYQICAGCGDQLVAGDSCVVRAVDASRSNFIGVSAIPQNGEPTGHRHCLGRYHKGAESQILSRLQLANLFSPEQEEGPGGDRTLHIGEIVEPHVRRVIVKAVIADGVDSAKRAEKFKTWLKTEVKRLCPVGEGDRKFREKFQLEDEFGLSAAANYEGNTRSRAAESLSGIDPDGEEDDANGPPARIKQNAYTKNRIEDAFVRALAAGILEKTARRVRAVLKAEREKKLPYKRPYREEPSGRYAPTREDRDYLERFAAMTDREIKDLYRAEIYKTRDLFLGGEITDEQRRLRIADARKDRDAALELAKEDRDTEKQLGDRLSSLIDTLNCTRLEGDNKPKKPRSKFFGGYERDVFGKEGETPLYCNHRPYAPPGAFAWRGTLSEFLQDPTTVSVEIQGLEVPERCKKDVFGISGCACESCLQSRNAAFVAELRSDAVAPPNLRVSFRKISQWLTDFVANPTPSPTADELDLRRKARAEWTHYERMTVRGCKNPVVSSKRVSKCFCEVRDALLNAACPNRVAWWPWNFEEKKTFDNSIVKALSLKREYEQAQWKHKVPVLGRRVPGKIMSILFPIFEADGVTPVLGGQKPKSAEKWRAAQEKMPAEISPAPETDREAAREWLDLRDEIVKRNFERGFYEEPQNQARIHFPISRLLLSLGTADEMAKRIEIRRSGTAPKRVRVSPRAPFDWRADRTKPRRDSTAAFDFLPRTIPIWRPVPDGKLAPAGYAHFTPCGGDRRNSYQSPCVDCPQPCVLGDAGAYGDLSTLLPAA
jgi:hypothetical protein